MLTATLRQCPQGQQPWAKVDQEYLASLQEEVAFITDLGT